MEYPDVAANNTAPAMIEANIARALAGCSPSDSPALSTSSGDGVFPVRHGRVQQAGNGQGSCNGLG